jgi:hypothetical protein
LYEPVVKAANAICMAQNFDPPACDPNPGLPPATQAAIQVNCQVHAAIFADETEPTLGYRITEAIATPGGYKGLDHLRRDVSLDVAWCKRIDLKTHAPALHMQGIEAYMVVGTICRSRGEHSSVGNGAPTARSH